MKSILLRCACLLALLAGPSRAETLLNPGFESGDLSGWSTFGPGWRTGAGADARSGSYGLVDDVLASDVDAWRGIFQNIPAIPDNFYHAGVWIRTVNIDSSESYFELQFLDASGTVIGQHQSSRATNDQAFTFYDIGTVLAPAGTVTASVRAVVYMPSAPPDTDFHVFDDFVFSNATPEHVLIQNWGFETGDFSGWSSFGQGWRIGTGLDAFSWTNGAVNDVLTSDVDEWRGLYQNLPVTAGLTYGAGVYIRAVNVESSQSFLELQWFDASGSILTQQTSAAVSADQSFLHAYIHDVVAPAGAVTASVRGIVRMLSAPTNSSDFHNFDEFYFLRPVDLSVSMTASTNLVEAYQLVTYSIVVSNRSPSMSGSYFVTNTLTTNLNFVSASGGSLHIGQTVAWSLFGLLGHSSTTLTVTATQPYFTGSTQEVANVVTVTVDSGLGDPIPGNDDADADTLTVGVPMFTTLVLAALGLVVAYAFHRHYRPRPEFLP